MLQQWNLLGQTPRRIIVAILALLLLAAGVLVDRSFRDSSHQLAMFDGGVPGTLEAAAALDFAHDNHIDQIISYSVINASPKARDDYLVRAEQLRVKIVVSVKDLLGPTDLDPANAAFHSYFGYYVHPELKAAGKIPTTDQQIEGIVKIFDPYPAVGGYYISDELPQDPTGPEGFAKWQEPLRHRHAQIQSLSDKPTKVSLYWTANPQRADFLRRVGPLTDELMVAYYFYPEGAGHVLGGVAELRFAGQALQAAAGEGGWFILQAFSWDAEPETAANLGFAPGSPAPNAGVMVDMARRALDGGARNLALFSYGYMRKTPGQDVQVAKALAEIRRLKDFS